VTNCDPKSSTGSSTPTTGGGDNDASAGSPPSNTNSRSLNQPPRRHNHTTTINQTDSSPSFFSLIRASPVGAPARHIYEYMEDAKEIPGQQIFRNGSGVRFLSKVERTNRRSAPEKWAFAITHHISRFVDRLISKLLSAAVPQTSGNSHLGVSRFVASSKSVCAWPLFIVR
jgi:hypothetical protein